MSIFQQFLDLLPICRRKIIFNSYSGRGWSDNPKYIAQELLRQEKKYDLVWLVSDKGIELPKGIRKVEINSRRCRYELATAKVIVSNVKTNPFFLKKKNQFYIQTWHGDFPMKLIEKEAEDMLSPEYLAETKKDSNKTDLIVSGSTFFSRIVRNSFWYNGEILECGLPRNDIFFRQDAVTIKDIRQQLRITSNTAVVLYAPTFRDHGEYFLFPDFKRVIESLRLHTGKEWSVVVRLHPNDQKRSSEIEYSDRVINGSFYPDMQELEKIAELLVTDYSSVMYDFAIQHKPVILFTPDLDVYRTCCRDLRPLYEELPFIRVSSDSEMQKSLPLALSKDYICEVDAFVREKIQYFDDGHASERVVARINQVISGNAR